MRLALELWGNDFARIERTCVTAESLGFDAVYYGESPNGLNLECWTVLAALARITTSVIIGPVVSNVLRDYRSPILLARQAATVAALSGGRLVFRTGAGAAKRWADPWWAPYDVRYPDYPTRIDDLDVTLARLRAWWSGPDVVPEDARAPLGLTHPPIPVTVAANGPRGLACVARHADCWEAAHLTPSEYARLDAGFRAEHPDAATRVRRALEVDVFTAGSAAGRRLMERRLVAERGPERAAWARRRALSGDAGEIRAGLDAYARAGVEELLVACHDPHDPEALAVIAEAVR